MKTCPNCNLSKENSEFYLRKKDSNLLSSWCKECEKSAWKKWYSENKEKRIKYCIDFNKKNRKSKIEWLNEIKNKPCKDCGQKYNPWVMEYDHIDSSNKEANVSTLLKHNCSKKKILKEIEKCELVCANCHREREWQRRLKKINNL